MNRLGVSALVGTLLLPLACGLGSPTASAATGHKGACTPSPQVLKAEPARVPGLSSRQVENATAIINAAARFHVPERGQTIAVMTALEASSLGRPTARQAQGAGAPGLFGR